MLAKPVDGLSEVVAALAVDVGVVGAHIFLVGAHGEENQLVPGLYQPTQYGYGTDVGADAGEVVRYAGAVEVYGYDHMVMWFCGDVVVYYELDGLMIDTIISTSAIIPTSAPIDSNT